MKTSMLSAITVLFLAFTFASNAVQVQEGEFSFSAESVRKLQALNISVAAEQRSPRLPSPGASWVCEDPELPLDFLPLCQQPGAAMALSNLVMVPMDVCEICSFPACTGC